MFYFFSIKISEIVKKQCLITRLDLVYKQPETKKTEQNNSVRRINLKINEMDETHVSITWTRLQIKHHKTWLSSYK